MVVIIPIFLDLVQPTKEIIAIKDIVPERNVITPRILSNIKSLLTIFFGNPTVVIIITDVHAKIETRNKLAAKVATTMTYFDNRVFRSEIKRFAITRIENPPSSELIKTVCVASLFQYSKVISSMIVIV